MADDSNTSNQIVQGSRDAAAISYIWIMSILVLIFKRDDRFVQFHARQSVVLFVLSLFVWLIPWIGNFLEVILAALMIFGFIQASQGQWYRFPVIADIVTGNFDLSQVRAKMGLDKDKRDSDQDSAPEKEEKTPEDLAEKEKRKKELAEKVARGEI